MSTNTTTADVRIQGMSCRHCVEAVLGALSGVAGLTVEEVGIGHARVAFQTNAVNLDAIEAAVEDAGYEVQAIEQVA